MRPLTYLILLTILAFFSCQSDANPGPPNDSILWTAAWNPDGEIIAVGGNHGQLKILSAMDFQQVQAKKVRNTITQLRWHPDGQVLAIAKQQSSEGPALIDRSAWKLVPLDSIAESGARGIGWNHSGEYLAIGDNEGDLIFFERSGQFVHKTQADPKAITGLSWHPSKNTVVAVGSQITIYDWDSETKKEIQSRPEDVLMLCVDWHPSGEFFVTGDYGDHNVGHPPLLQFWDAEGNNIRDIEESPAEYRNLEWSSDGERLATASDAVRLWTPEGELIRALPAPELLWGLSWDPDNKRLVTTNVAGNVAVWRGR